METTKVTLEEESSQMSHSMKVSAQKKKRTFISSEEESFHNTFPIISAEVMSVKELLDIESSSRHRTWEIMRDMAQVEYRRTKRTLFGNECEKMERDVSRTRRILRSRVDKIALRNRGEEKVAAHKSYLEALSRKAPDFIIPLRSHTVWEGMRVVFTCTVQGYPPPRITWYKDGVPLRCPHHEWNYTPKLKHGICTLEIRRCSPADAGKYKVVAKSALGQATTFATLLVNSYQGATSASERSQTSIPEAQFACAFSPNWVTEGETLTLQCIFTCPLLPFQQDVTWYRDGVQLEPSKTVAMKTDSDLATLTLEPMHKEHEGLYTVQLRTRSGTQEHSAFVYVKDAAATVPGGPASPLAVQVSDINKDYVFLTWQPPSADGSSPVEGYYVEKKELSEEQWTRCNAQIQKVCHFPVFGLKPGAYYQFRVCAVNKAGVGRPSKPTEPILTMDPQEADRKMVVSVDRGRTITVTKDELEGDVTAPFPPTDVHVCEGTDTYLVLSWSPPEPRGREPLTYHVERSLAGTNNWERASLDMVVSSPRFPVFDLVKGRKYCFRVRAVNKYGVSDPSAPSAPVSLRKPQVPPSPPHSLMPLRDTDTSVQLKWQEPEDKEDILGYYLYYSETGKQNWKTINNKPYTKTSFTVHGLKTGKEYVFRAKSVSRAGNSIYSEESPPITVKAAIRVPSAPSAIVLLLCTDSEMVVGWRAPAHSGGAPVRGYYLDKKEEGAEMWREVNEKAVPERKLKVSNLTSGNFYQFRVFAANMVGVGKPSEPSEPFLCEKWTMPEPGCPYDVQIKEIRDTSLVAVWAAPLYEGQGPIIGYILEVCQGDQSDEWTAINDQPISSTHYKVSGLETGQTYCLRVTAVNEAGAGCPSLPSEPFTVTTPPGSKDIEIGVDDDGFICLTYAAEEINEETPGLWNKEYCEPIDESRAQTHSEKNRAVLTFTDASEEDLGLYTVEVTDNPSMSSSYDFTADDLERLKELSWQVRNPLIGLKTGWQVEVSEEGRVRLWLQTESLSDAAELRLILNDQEIHSTPHRTITLDKAKGLVEIVFDPLSPEDQGSYTAQLRDGKAKNQFTLVFVDDLFHQTLALADANRHNHKRKFGPHFEEYLSWSVTDECVLVIKCKVTNTTKETTLKWFKEGKELKEAVYDPASGLSSFTVPQVTQEEMGTYKAVVSDKRGEDQSFLKLSDEEYDKLLQQLSKQCALSAGPLSIECTEEGFRLFCSLKYYINYLKTSWLFKDKPIDQTRTRPGYSTQKVWIDVFNPTEKDQGKYTLEMFDGKETHKRHLNLSGQAFADALKEYQRLKQAALDAKRRAHVIKGLPDVVAIMEGKTLCLTCFVDGDPYPDIFWLRNDKRIASQGQFDITKEHKCTTITINNVTMQDSGKYSIFVENKYGSETVDVTVSVYKHGDKPPAHAVLMG
ncbi:myomesin-3 [Periophthalmus magnuspinnatus]|uniref:myomesin-3 n=1 Tax=Periophthalmus magnuspinnatus TaxID=409849 RepID=UPI00145A6F08|nr:myomesin-3 [Periophthalmus magnuspinnatus]